MPRPAKIAILLTLAAAAAVGQQQAQQDGQQGNATIVTIDQRIPANFSIVRVCVPFNVLISPPSGGNMQNASARAVFSAEPSVINATRLTLTPGGALAVSLAAGFSTTQPINFTLYLGQPVTGVTNSGSGTTVLAPGLNARSLIIATYGVGQVVALNISAQHLQLLSTGVGGTYASGNITNATVRATGTGTTTLESPRLRSVDAQLGGIAQLLVNGTASTSITGSANGLSGVTYTNGSCDVSSTFVVGFPGFGGLFAPIPFFGSPFGGGGGIFSANKCQQLASDGMTAAPRPEWSCGLIVDGNSTCLGGEVTNLSTVVLGPGTVSTTPYPPLNVSSSSEMLNPPVNAANATTGMNATAGNATNVAVGRPMMPVPTGVQPAAAPAGVPGVQTQTFTSGPGSSAMASGTNPIGTQTTSSASGAPQTTTVNGVPIGGAVFSPGTLNIGSLPTSTFAQANIGGSMDATASTVGSGGTATSSSSGAGGTSVMASSNTGGAQAATTTQVQGAVGMGGQPLALGVAAVSTLCNTNSPLYMVA